MLNQLADIVRYLRVPLSARAVAVNLGVSKTTVARYARLLNRYGLPPGRAQVEDCSARELSTHLNRTVRASGKAPPDFTGFEKRLAEPGITLLHLHAEYAETVGSQALGYVQFTRLFRVERRKKQLVMRQAHDPGFVAFVDYSGKRPWYVERRTGAKVNVELFVGVLGHSGLTFVCCSPTQTVADWLGAHAKMLEFFGGAPKTIVPDNLKSAVVRAGKDPTIQRRYLEWGRYYGTAVLPARAKHPRDKGQVEKAVLDVQRAMLPALASRKHFSVEELNAHIEELLMAFNNRTFQKRAGSRRSIFEDEERAALVPLPSSRYDYVEWTGELTVPADYHVPIQGHYYSVPHELVGEKVEGRMSMERVEIHRNGDPVASHARSAAKGRQTTDPRHLHETHRAQGRRTAENALAWAAGIGVSMKTVMDRQFAQYVPLQGLPGALALWDLEKHWGRDALERAATLAVARRVPNPTGIKRMLTELGAKKSAPARAVALSRGSRRKSAGPARAQAKKSGRSPRKRAS